MTGNANIKFAMKLMTVSSANLNNIQMTNIERIVIRMAISIGATVNIKSENKTAAPQAV